MSKKIKLILPTILVFLILYLVLTNTNEYLLLLIPIMLISFILQEWIASYFIRRRYLFEIDRILNNHYINQTSNDTTILLLNRLNNYIQSVNQENMKNKEEAKKLIEDITHQIKTPLAALKINVDLIENEDIREACIQNIDRIDDMVTTLIHMAKLEAHTMPFTFINNSLQECFEEILDDLAYMIEQKQLMIQSDIEDLYFSFDYLWLKESFTNIIKNGIEYSPIGGTLYIKAFSQGTHIWIEIADEGQGFIEDEKDHVFDRFYSSKKDSRKQKGMGIGLNIAYEVIQAHKGSIYVQQNNRTTFMIRLPILQGKEKI